MAKRMLKMQLDLYRESSKDPFNMYNSVQIGLLLDHIKALEEDETIYRKKIQRMQEHIDRLRDKVVRLESERRALAEKLETKKVVLPEEVAVALKQEIDSRRDDDLDFLAWSIPHEIDETDDDSMVVLKEYVNARTDTSFFDIVDAIRYGFTVEEVTAEQRMLGKMEALLEEHKVQCPMPLKQLAEKLVIASRVAVAESRQEETSN